MVGGWGGRGATPWKAENELIRVKSNSSSLFD